MHQITLNRDFSSSRYITATVDGAAGGDAAKRQQASPERRRETSMIDHDTWKMIEIIIRRYPAAKKEYEQYIDKVMTSSSAPAAGVDFSEDYSKPQSVTEAKALKMTFLPRRAETLKKQIEAVELVYSNLKPEEQKVMQNRFWSDRRRNIPYTKMDKVAYSERQMRRIVKKIILKVGIYLGEI